MRKPKLKKSSTRESQVLQKFLDPHNWNLEQFLSYCQGRAYNTALNTILLTGDDDKESKEKRMARRKRLITMGLRQMVHELCECLKLIEAHKEID